MFAKKKFAVFFPVLRENARGTGDRSQGIGRQERAQVIEDREQKINRQKTTARSFDFAQDGVSGEEAC